MNWSGEPSGFRRSLAARAIRFAVIFVRAAPPCNEPTRKPAFDALNDWLPERFFRHGGIADVGSLSAPCFASARSTGLEAWKGLSLLRGRAYRGPADNARTLVSSVMMPRRMRSASTAGFPPFPGIGVSSPAHALLIGLAPKGRMKAASKPD